MKKEIWIQTKKELERDNDDNWNPVKITVEKENLRFKDKYDLLIRILSLSAIIIPVLLFYFQQQSEIKKQKRIFRFETYINTSATIHEIVEKKHHEQSFESSKERLYYELYPKVKFLQEREIVSVVDSIKSLLDLYNFIQSNYDYIDTLKVCHYDKITLLEIMFESILQDLPYRDILQEKNLETLRNSILKYIENSKMRKLEPEDSDISSSSWGIKDDTFEEVDKIIDYIEIKLRQLDHNIELNSEFK